MRGLRERERDETEERGQAEVSAKRKMGEEKDENDGVPWVVEMRKGVLPSAAFYL